MTLIRYFPLPHWLVVNNNQIDVYTGIFAGGYPSGTSRPNSVAISYTIILLSFLLAMPRRAKSKVHEIN